MRGITRRNRTHRFEQERLVPFFFLCFPFFGFSGLGRSQARREQSTRHSHHGRRDLRICACLKGSWRTRVHRPWSTFCAIVCRSGTVEADRWIAESHNVAADYLRAFGKLAPQMKGLRLQINSQQTGSDAESYLADVVFRKIAPK